ncbi:MAG TPA: hypothetical protein VFV93_08440, partial [Thermomicrobiales bacterium]|nr:hypothetical protein [Thermomicrobiales bacterium]
MPSKARALLRLPRSHAVRKRAVQLLMLVLALVTLAGPILGPTGREAAAQVSDFSPPPLLSRDQLNSPDSDRYRATVDQIRSLANLEQQAVQATLHNHGLPASDADAVRSWGRADATAELWGLVVEAIQTPEASRDPDQQNVVDWLAAASKRQSVLAADY